MIGHGVAVDMPGGVWRNGARRRDAKLRALDAGEAVALAEDGASLAPVVLATALLAHCLVELGGEAPVSAEAVRRLSVGDREALLLHLHRITYGDRIDLCVDCPFCRVRLDLSVKSSEMLLEPYRSAPKVRQRMVTLAHGRCRIRFRLPTGADVEAAILVEGDAVAAELIVSRCIESVNPARPPRELVASLDWLMAKLDPQAELRFNLRCPECGTDFAAVLDMAKQLWQQLAAQARTVFWEIHIIASAYHWSESAILALPPARRRRYLGLINALGAVG